MLTARPNASHETQHSQHNKVSNRKLHHVQQRLNRLLPDLRPVPPNRNPLLGGDLEVNETAAGIKGCVYVNGFIQDVNAGYNTVKYREEI